VAISIWRVIYWDALALEMVKLEMVGELINIERLSVINGCTQSWKKDKHVSKSSVSQIFDGQN